jgi:SRSO17 transposase
VDLESKSEGGQTRFAAYVEVIAMTLGHADRTAPFRSYCTGLLLPGDRKSVEPMAARVEPDQRVGPGIVTLTSVGQPAVTS